MLRDFSVIGALHQFASCLLNFMLGFDRFYCEIGSFLSINCVPLFASRSHQLELYLLTPAIGVLWYLLISWVFLFFFRALFSFQNGLSVLFSVFVQICPLFLPYFGDLYSFSQYSMKIEIPLLINSFPSIKFRFFPIKFPFRPMELLINQKRYFKEFVYLQVSGVCLCKTARNLAK